MDKATPRPRALGGNFAPPLTPEKLASYRTLIEAQSPGHTREVMLSLCKMIEVFRETPDSKLAGKRLVSSPFVSADGKRFEAFAVPLEDAEIKRVWDVVPWPEEIEMYRALGKKLTGELRDAFYHLLWYAEELSKDREPITTEKLQPQ